MDASKPIPFDSPRPAGSNQPSPDAVRPLVEELSLICTCVPRVTIFKLFATECYRPADASRPIPFDSPQRGNFNETLPDSAGHLPAEVSAFFTLLTSIAMWTLRELYHSIPLAQRNPTHSVRTLSNRWFTGYPYFCTLVLPASTFKLLATEYSCFLD